MRKTNLILVLLAALTLPGCVALSDSGTPPSFTLGITGKTSDGQNYMLGLNVPLPTFRKKADPASTPVKPPLPQGAGSGKTPVLLQP